MKFPPVESPGIRQFGRFVVVGCLNVAVSFAVFMLLYRVFPLASMVLDAMGSLGARISNALLHMGVQSVDAALANTIGALAGMANSFVLNKRWTFEAGGLTHLQVRRFVVLNVLVIAGSSLIVFVFIDVLRAPYLLVWIVTTGLAMIENFLGNKYWTFAEASGFGGTARRASADGRL
jgi:putative flippase GtrA